METTLPGQFLQRRGGLLHRIADKHHGARTHAGLLPEGGAQQTGDLGATRGAVHAAHIARQQGGIAAPVTQLDFAQAAVIRQLDRQRGEIIGGPKHVRLKLAGQIPGRLAARRGIDSEHQARSLRAVAPQIPGALHKGADLCRVRLFSRGARHNASGPT